MLDNSDDYDFNPSNSSKLASLFGNVSINSESNTSLVYKAPKPNAQDSKKTDDSNATKTSVVIGKVISLWKLECDNYVAFGKHGLAIIGSSEKKTYEIIGYKEKTNILFRVRINNTLIFYNQKDNFSTFYDNNSINWLVKFEGNDQDDFTKILESYDVKIADNSPDINTKTEKPELPEKPILDHINKDDSHSDSSDSKQRANILNRMAKMGQAILPNSGVRNTSTELSDSDFDEKLQERRIPPRQIKRTEKNTKLVSVTQLQDTKTISNNNKVVDNLNYHNPLQNEISNSQLISNQMYNNQLVHAQAANPQVPNQIYNPQMYHPSWSNDGYNQYIIAQNTELKTNLAQISSKLDTVLNLKKSDEEVDKKILLSKLKTMKLRMENLEIALQNSEKENSSLRLKYVELEKKNHETCVDELKNKEIDILENTISELKLKLHESENQHKIMFLEQESLKNKVTEQEEITEMQKDQLKEYESLKSESKNAEELNETIKSLNNTITVLKLKQKDFEEYFEKVESEKKGTAQTCQSKLKLLHEFVKRHMNEMYQSILDDFQEEGSYQYLDIQKSVAKNLKTTCFKIIENCDNIFKQSNILEE